MSTIICNYAVLRFQPYPETGEFANLGIVMLCNNGQFLQRSESRARQRITHFFDKLPPEVFMRARREFLHELKRVTKLANDHTPEPAMQRRIFQHLVAPRETMFRFSQPGTIATEDPQQALDDLFMRYVHHSFSQRQNLEARLTSRVGQWLRDFTDRHYSESTLGDDLLQVRFPLVWEQGGIIRQAVKPISFDLEETSKIIEKGDKWLMRMKRLKASGNAPMDTVFVSHAPSENDKQRHKAYREVTRGLTEGGLLRIVPDTLGQAGVTKQIAEPSMH